MEQRRTQRYRLQLPLQIIQLGDKRVNRTEKTRDISSGGVCFLSPTNIEVGGRIEYLITLSGSHPPVRIRCLGKVLRSFRPTKPGEAQAGTPTQNPEAAQQYEVAVTMERYQFVRAGELETAGSTAQA